MINAAASESETFTGTIAISRPIAFGIHAPGNVVIAQYHPESDTTTFDWPAIEREATCESWCRGIAKILLAARAAGREP
jgi:hypothetical protein